MGENEYTVTSKTALKNFLVATKIKNVTADTTVFEDVNTTDLIFINSRHELNEFENDEQPRKISATDWAMVNGAKDERAAADLKYAIKLNGAEYWLRSPWEDFFVSTMEGDTQGAERANTLCCTVCPSAHLDLNSVFAAQKASKENFKFGTVENKNGRVLYHTVEFGQYPKSFVGKYLGGEILAMYDSVWAGKDDDKAIFLQKLKGKEELSESI